MTTSRTSHSVVGGGLSLVALTAPGLALTLALVLAAHGEAVAQTAEAGGVEVFAPNVRPTLEVARASGAIRVDGRLDDAGWVGAARAHNFAEHFPREQARPPVESVVFVTYDDEHLYLGFVAYDDPSTIRTSLRDRDEIWQDDYFGILLDTYGDAAWAYFLFANPLGVQGDTRFSSSGGEDDGFDIIYRSEAQVTDSGYQIEMAIPFASLRFPDRDVQSWRATFWRTRPRGSRAQHTWAALNRDEQCFLCQFGTLTGIQGVKPGGALEVLPAVVASQASTLADASDPTAGLASGDPSAQVSLGARYAFSSGFTAEGTYNPDFSQVESDAGQIDVNTTFALFFPERRPFFQEGSDLFDTYFNAVYTRQINDPRFATKLVGRMGRTTVAYLGAFDETSPLLLPFEERSFVGAAGKSVSNIGRFRQTFGSNSYVGALVTDRRMTDHDGAGSVAGIDGVFAFLDRYQVEFQLLGSRTEEPDDTALTSRLNGLAFDRGRHTAAFDGESYGGWAQYTSFERSARMWSFDFDYWASSPTFRADNGFESRNDFRRVSMWQGLAIYPNTRLVDQLRPNVYTQRTWNFDGVRKSEFVAPSLEMNLTGQTFVDLEYVLARERFADVWFGDLRSWNVYVQSNFSDPVRASVFVSRGRRIGRNVSPPVLGTGTVAEASLTLKPMQRLVLTPSLQFQELHEVETGRELFSGYLLRTRSSFQFTRELFLRLVVQYDDFDGFLSVELLLTYKINPFSLVYLGSTHGYQDYGETIGAQQVSRQFFAKVQYLFRR